jgi:hypothetical protein
MTMPDRDVFGVSPRVVAGAILNTLGTKSQVGKVLFHLIKRGSITQVEAHELYRVYRLASRIHDLKTIGVTITTNVKMDMTGTRYVEYSL